MVSSGRILCILASIAFTRTSRNCESMRHKFDILSLICKVCFSFIYQNLGSPKPTNVLKSWRPASTLCPTTTFKKMMLRMKSTLVTCANSTTFAWRKDWIHSAYDLESEVLPYPTNGINRSSMVYQSSTQSKNQN
jgi:hypothetical protein